MKGVILNKIVECTAIIILIILFTIQNYFKNSYSASTRTQAHLTKSRAHAQMRISLPRMRA